MFKNFTWGHGIVAALGAFMIFILSMIFIFSRGWQNAELVSDDYYRDELIYQKVIDAKNLAQKLPQQPIYHQDANGIKITFPQEIVSGSSAVRFELFRTDDERLDIKKEVTLSSDHSFLIPAKVLAPGNYTLKLHWKKEGKDYQVDYDVLWKQR